MYFEPEKESVRRHEVPEWYHDAKLGIFIHWGLYSVPAFAITGISIDELIREEGFEGNFLKNPYAEWYLNSLKIKDTPTQKYHMKTYGKNFTYDDLIPKFNEAIKSWNPEEMAKIFKNAGARYVVLGTKHHDGFILWPSDYPNPKKKNYHADRNIVGELTNAVKTQGLKMGFYYSGAFDWTFNPEPITDIITFLTNGPTETEYIEYVDNHWRELIDKFKPWILWNDIGYPPGTNVYELFAYFYNKNPEGVVNDRWIQTPKALRKILKFKPISALIRWIVNRSLKKGGSDLPEAPHFDFKTPEYTSFSTILEQKWESTRGMGNSFGYNQFETEEDYLTIDELIKMFVDIVSKNGNLLLNVGPKADGSIPEIQKQLLLKLGEWLKINGEAIYGSRPWIKAEDKTEEDIHIRYTQKKESLYIFLMDITQSSQITLGSLKIKQNSNIYLIGKENELDWKLEDEKIIISLPKELPDFPVHVLKISPMPGN